MSKTYTEEEVHQLIKEATDKVMISTATHCAEYADSKRGYLTIGDDIRNHYKIIKKEPFPKLRIVK